MSKLDSATYTATGNTSSITVGAGGKVLLGVSANSGAFNVTLQANIGGVWQNIATALTATGTQTTEVPPGTAVRVSLNTVGTNVVLGMVA